MLEYRAVMFIDEGETIWCDEPEADAFGLYAVDGDDELLWIADFADYGTGLQFAENYATDNDLVLVDRVRPPIKQIP